MATSESFGFLSSRVDGIFSLVQSLASKRDDQSVLMTSVAGQVQMQGERLRQIEADLDAVKHLVTTGVKESLPVKAVDRHKNTPGNNLDLEAVRRVVREEVEAALKANFIRDQVNESVKEELKGMTEELDTKSTGLTSKMAELENVFTSSLDKLDDSVSDLRSSLEDQECMMTDIQNKSNVLDNKVFRLTAILGHSTTRLSEEFEMKAKETQGLVETTSSELNGKLGVLENELKKQTAELSKVRNGLNNNLSQKIDTLTKSSQKHGEKVEQILIEFKKQVKAADLNKIKNSLTKHMTDEMDGLSQAQKSQGENVAKLRREMTSQGHSIIDQVLAEARITRDVVRNSPQDGRSYICDFHVFNLDDFIGSGRKVYSRIWYIHQVDMSFKASATFDKTNNITFTICLGQYPAVIGCEWKKQKQEIPWNVTVMSPDEKDDQNWKLGGDKFCIYGGSKIPIFCDGWVHLCGWEIPTVVSCDELNKRGLVFKNKIIARFEIKVL